MGRVDAVCSSERKGCRKRPSAALRFVSGHGIEGDAHSGPWHRQISLLAQEDIDGLRQKGLALLEPGDFAENVIVSNVDLAGLGLGSRLRLGCEVEISVTQLGKVCHSRCVIYKKTGDCVMPRAGVFARVVGGGEVRSGDTVDVLVRVPRELFQAVVLTISDRCAAGTSQDTAGPAVCGLIEGALGAHVYTEEILPDDQPRIAERLKHYCDGHSIDLVITVGGTGFAPRDVTPEAVASVIERPTPGLDEAMRFAAQRHTPHAMLSRCVSGIRGSTLILSLPGSERAAVENLDAVLPAMGHGLAKLRGDRSDCGAGSAPGRSDPRGLSFSS